MYIETFLPIGTDNLLDQFVWKHPWFGNYDNSLGRNQETAWFRVLKLCKASHSNNAFKLLHTFI